MTVGIAAELSNDGIAVEPMAEAALALAACDAKLTGRITYSLDLLRALGREVRTLDGREVCAPENAQSR